MSSCPNKSASRDYRERDAADTELSTEMQLWEERLYHAINRGDSRTVRTLLNKGRVLCPNIVFVFEIFILIALITCLSHRC